MTEDDESKSARPVKKGPKGQDNKASPVYEKPAIRKYDQIDQVKPYGPNAD